MNATSQVKQNNQVAEARRIVSMMKLAENNQPLQHELRMAALSKLEELLNPIQ